MDAIMRQSVHDYESTGWSSDGYLQSWWNDYWSLVDLTHAPHTVNKHAPNRAQAQFCVQRMKELLNSTHSNPEIV